MDSFRVWIVIQCQFVMTESWPEKTKRRAGIRLTEKACEIDSLTRFGKGVLFILVVDRIMGKVRMINEVVAIVGSSVLITFIWSCTNFLAPKTNGWLPSFKS